MQGEFCSHCTGCQQTLTSFSNKKAFVSKAPGSKLFASAVLSGPPFGKAFQRTRREITGTQNVRKSFFDFFYALFHPRQSRRAGTEKGKREYLHRSKQLPKCLPVASRGNIRFCLIHQHNLNPINSPRALNRPPPEFPAHTDRSI